MNLANMKIGRKLALADRGPRSSWSYALPGLALWGIRRSTARLDATRAEGQEALALNVSADDESSIGTALRTSDCAAKTDRAGVVEQILTLRKEYLAYLEESQTLARTTEGRASAGGCRQDSATWRDANNAASSQAGPGRQARRGGRGSSDEHVAPRFERTASQRDRLSWSYRQERLDQNRRANSRLLSRSSTVLADRGWPGWPSLSALVLDGAHPQHRHAAARQPSATLANIAQRRRLARCTGRVPGARGRNRHCSPRPCRAMSDSLRR